MKIIKEAELSIIIYYQIEQILNQNQVTIVKIYTIIIIKSAIRVDTALIWYQKTSYH